MCSITHTHTHTQSRCHGNMHHLNRPKRSYQSIIDAGEEQIYASILDVPYSIGKLITFKLVQNSK